MAETDPGDAGDRFASGLDPWQDVDVSAPVTILLVITLAAAGVILAWSVYVTRLETRRRLAMLDGVADRLENVRRTRSPWRYPRLEGTWRGSPVRVDLVPDTMVRKDVPSMWGQVVWERPQPAALYVTVDPRGSEYLIECDIHEKRTIKAPPHWPPRTHVCADDEGGARLLAELADLDLKRYRHLKQLAVRPDGLSVTVRCARARRRPRLLLPTNDFTTEPVRPAVIDEALTLLGEVDHLLRPGAAG